MTVHYRDDTYLDKLIKEKFTFSFMNDTKWVKLISLLIENSSEIKLCKVKPIWDDKEPYRKLLFTDNTKFGFDFYNNAMEAMVSDEPTGWYSYKEIHWLDFPIIVNNESETKFTLQNIQLIKKLIENIGHYKTELTESNLRLYAYFT